MAILCKNNIKVKKHDIFFPYFFYEYVLQIEHRLNLRKKGKCNKLFLNITDTSVPSNVAFGFHFINNIPILLLLKIISNDLINLI